MLKDDVALKGTRFLCFLTLFLLALTTTLKPVWALENPEEKLPSLQQELLAEQIGRQLRCPVCQNANIEESSAPLAKTLRTAIRQQVAEGKNENDILQWMQERYGDFIFLTPPLSRYSFFLWITPILSLLIGMAIFLMRRKTLYSKAVQE
ncbi:cytochrome c-type biogenesis protein CcmH [Acetobacteraceae bacterium]|nr:cytochrome c-type biogenesis protein CcmH [Acetobacteraceae bacterium]